MHWLLFVILLALGFGFMLWGRSSRDPILFLLGCGILFIAAGLLYGTGLTVTSGGTEITYTRSDLGVFALSFLLLALSLLGFIETYAVFRR